MRLRKVKDAKEKMLKSSYYLDNPKDYKNEWSKLFKNDHPIHLEIGCGKGQFLIQNALQNPDKNYIGMEKYESVLIRAIEKIENLSLTNIYFINQDAQDINEIFSQEIDTIYLNFSDPWPKNRHEKRRLTSEDFLKKYEKVFANHCHIIQKTDNISLFAYSLEQFSKNGYTLEKVSLDLAKEKMINYQTEYEEKFSADGYKINYVEVYKYK